MLLVSFQRRIIKWILQKRKFDDRTTKPISFNSAIITISDVRNFYTRYKEFYQTSATRPFIILLISKFQTTLDSSKI